MTDDQKPAVVLLVEDEALVRMFADEVLTEDGGFKVIATANADEASPSCGCAPTCGCCSPT
jgi:DNA-binding NarL/FixJ family response regulator